MQDYVAQFPDIEARIAKRERRALDVTRTRRTLEHAKEKKHVGWVQRQLRRQSRCTHLPPFLLTLLARRESAAGRGRLP